MNISQYYFSKFNTTPVDTTLKNLPVDSVCGADCKEAIDAVASYINVRRRAIGAASDWEDHIMVDLDEIIGVFWRG